jgi:hypothetical protein
MLLKTVQIDALVAALPGCADTHKGRLLPRILKEWAQTELEDHLSRSTAKEFRDERRQIQQASRRALELAHALWKLGLDGRFAIACQMQGVEPGSWPESDAYSVIQETDRLLGDEPQRLKHLAASASTVARLWAAPAVRHHTLVRYLVLQDLAEIYRWATNKRPGRRVRTDVSPDAGMHYGPFWDFASAAWPIIFGSTAGLNSAFKLWAERRRRLKESSPVIVNLHMAHPQWRILKESRSKPTIRSG